MSKYERCPLCREYGWLNEPSSILRHICKPSWQCRAAWHSDDDDAWETVHAHDAERAAEKFAERYDCEGGEYAIVGMKMREDCVIQVRKPGDDAFERWSIQAEAVPTYYATKIESVPTTGGEHG